MKPIEVWSIITGTASILGLLLTILSITVPFTIPAYSYTDGAFISITLWPLFLCTFFISLSAFIITIVLWKR